MQKADLFMRKVTAETKERFLAFTSDERIAIKLDGLRKLKWQGYTAPAMHIITARINQNRYVVSGECKANSDRYIREVERRFNY